MKFCYPIQQVDIMFSNAGIASPIDQTVMELDMSQFDFYLRSMFKEWHCV